MGKKKIRLITMSNFLSEESFLISASYREASQNAVDMKYATEALESIQNAMINNDFLTAWGVIDEYIGRTSIGNLQQVLFNLRRRFKDIGFKHVIHELHKQFHVDKKNGWNMWLRTYIQGLSSFRLDYCSALSHEQFSYPSVVRELMEKISYYTDLLLRHRNVEANGLYILLGEYDLVPNSSRADMYFYAAQTQLYSLLKPGDAKLLLEKGLELSPESGRVMCGFGQYYLEVDERDLAKQYLSRCLKKGPKLIEAYLAIGYYYERDEKFNEAEKWYRKTIQEFPGSSRGYRALYSLCSRLEDLEDNEDEILELARVASLLSPDLHYEIDLDLALIYRNHGNYERAHQLFKDAITMDNTRPEAYVYISSAYLQEGRLSKSLAALQKAIRNAPDAFDGYWAMSLWYESQENWKKASYWYQESLKKRPE